MKYELTEHAKNILEERKIPIAYVERVIQNPELSLQDENDPNINIDWEEFMNMTIAF